MRHLWGAIVVSTSSSYCSKAAIFATILAVVMGILGAYAQRKSAPTLERAETAYTVDANGNAHSELN